MSPPAQARLQAAKKEADDDLRSSMSHEARQVRESELTPAEHATRIAFSGNSAAHIERLGQSAMWSAIPDVRHEISAHYLERCAATPIPARAMILERTPHIVLRIRELQRQKLTYISPSDWEGPRSVSRN